MRPVFNSLKWGYHLSSSLGGDAQKNRKPFHTSLALSQPYLLESAGARMNPKCGLNSSPPPTPHIQDTSCRGGVRCGRRGEVDEALGRDANHGESRGQMLPLSCLGSGRGCLPMSPSWRCKGLPPKGPTCCHPRAPGRRRKPRSSIPLGFQVLQPGIRARGAAGSEMPGAQGWEPLTHPEAAA